MSAECGTRYGYRSGCHCQACRGAEATYQRERRGEHVRHAFRADLAQRHIAALQAAGLSLFAIAAAAGVHDRTIRRIANGQSKWLQKRTHEAILGVPLDEVPSKHLVPVRYLLPLLDALRAAGIGPSAVCRAMRIKRKSLQLRQWAQPRTADRIITLYRLAARQGLVDATLLDEVC